MEPSPNITDIGNLSAKSLITQLNAFCQADVKTQWTQKRLRTSREVCGFSYVENSIGEWVMMPTLCPNCHNILGQAVKGLVVEYNRSNQQSKKKVLNTETIFEYPSPLVPLPGESETYDTDSNYLLYPATSNSNYRGNNGEQPKLEFYRPSLAAGGCCSIL
jgi:hypothetical protein